MPTLTWTGKDAVANYHQKVPFHLLKDVPSLSVGDPGTGNLIVEGDNPEWKPRVFYIDDQDHLDPPDEEPGSYGNGGYQVSDLQGLPAGTYTLVSVMYNAPAFAPELSGHI